MNGYAEYYCNPPIIDEETSIVIFHSILFLIYVSHVLKH